MKKLFIAATAASLMLLTFSAFAFYCDFSSVVGKSIPFSQFKKICPQLADNMLHKAKKNNKKPIPGDKMITIEPAQAAQAQVQVRAYKFPELKNKTCVFVLFPNSSGESSCTSE